MNAFVAFFPIFAALAVAALPFTPRPGEPVLLKHLLAHPHGEEADPRVAAFVHGGANVKPDLGPERLARFLLLVPTLGADLTGGVVSSGSNGGLHPHRVTFVDPVFPGEHLLELVGFSDCETWFALNATFWHPALGPTLDKPTTGGATFKAAGFVKNKNGDWVKHALFPGVLTPFTGETFFDFVKFRLHFLLVPKLLEVLPSHPVAHALAGRLPKVVKPRVLPPPEELPEPSAPVVLDPELFRGERHEDRLAFLHPVSVVDGDHKARFVHLAPTLFSDLTGGFATPGRLHPHVLPVTLPDFPAEHLVELVGFSDCETWFAFHLTFWHPGLGGVTHRAAGFVKNKAGDWVKEALLPGPTHPGPGRTVVEFLKEHVHWQVLGKFVSELPSHPLVHVLDTLVNTRPGVRV